jgi:hypothetical protein
MKSLFLVYAVTFIGCANDNGTPRTFANSDLELAVGNSARMGCSCLFVMEMSEAYCRAWVKASPDVAKVSFDRANKRVESSAFLSWAATARYVDDKRGCILE